jgi:hypothetical protein
MEEARQKTFLGLAPGARPLLLVFINRLLGGLPAKIYRRLARNR